MTNASVTRMLARLRHQRRVRLMHLSDENHEEYVRQLKAIDDIYEEEEDDIVRAAECDDGVTEISGVDAL